MVNLVCKVSGGREEFNHFAGQSMGRVFYAELDMASGRNVAGCPCGRGSTEAEAVGDLKERIARENGPAFKFSLACPSLATKCEECGTDLNAHYEPGYTSTLCPSCACTDAKCEHDTD